MTALKLVKIPAALKGQTAVFYIVQGTTRLAVVHKEQPSPTFSYYSIEVLLQFTGELKPELFRIPQIVLDEDRLLTMAALFFEDIQQSTKILDPIGRVTPDETKNQDRE